MNKKGNFNIGKRDKSESKPASGNPLETNRRKFEEYIARVDPVDGVENIPDEISGQLIIEYINQARTQPKQFASLLRNKLKDYKSEKLYIGPYMEMRIQAIEGKKAVEEAIKFCQKQKPTHALITNEALMLSTFDHCMDLVRSQFLQHVGSDGSQFWDRISRRGKFGGGGAQNCDHVMWYCALDYAQQTVIRYIVDEGVPSRGHRKNIFNSSYYYVGACMLKSPKTGYKGVVNFSSSDVPLQNADFSSRNFNYKRGKNFEPSKKKQEPIKEPSKQNPEQNQPQYKPPRLASKTQKNQQQSQTPSKQPSNKEPPRVNQNQFQELKPKINPDNYQLGTINIQHTRLTNIQDQQFSKIWKELNSNANTMSLKNHKYLLGAQGNMFQDSFNAKVRAGKQVVSTATKTKITTTNGIKKTQITKTIKYSDGSSETVTKIV